MTQEKKSLIEKLLHAFWLEMNVWEKETYNDYTTGEDHYDKKEGSQHHGLLHRPSL